MSLTNRPYAYWGRPAYAHFYYFSTPLRQWWKFKGLIRWPNMPRSLEHRILRALDVFLWYTSYWWRRRVKLARRRVRELRRRGPLPLP